ncbi:MAG: ATP-binding protein [Bacteroidota bacterium]
MIVGINALMDITILVLNGFGKTRISRWLFIIISSNSVYFFAAKSNYYAGEYLMFPLVLALCPLLVDFNKWQNIVISVSIVMAYYLVNEFRVLANIEAIGTPELQDIYLYRSNLFLVMLGVFIISYFYFYITNKQQKQLLRAKEIAESSSKAKTHFLSVMSHEIRTPLNTVIGLSNVLQNKGLQKEEKDNIDLIHFSSNNLLAIVNDILDWSKIESGKLELEKINVDLKKLLDSVMAAGHFLARKKNLDFISEIDETLPKWLKTDSTRLTQILNNLIGNAVKFTDRGYIKLTTKVLRKNNDVATIEFKISDTGIGMTPVQEKKIFGSFSQADPATTRKYGGTGLGLTISQKMVQLMGGEIKVSSQLGVGSSFEFQLDLPISETAAKEVEIENSSVLAGKSILIVDDNQLNILVAQKFLNNWSINHDKAYNGLEAVNKVSENSYDLILMDLSMPEMDGFESTIEIRRMGYSKLPIIALTASALLDDREKIYRSGMNDLLNKPFNPLHLYEKLVHYLS